MINNILSNPTATLIIGAFVGFLFSILKDIINHNIKTKKEEKEQTLKHLDEIFVLLSKHYNSVGKTLTDLLDQQRKREDFDDTSTRLSFLIRVYFPHLEKEYQKYLKDATDFGAYQVKLSRQITIDQLSDIASSQEYINKSYKVHCLYGELCTLIVNESKEI